MKRLETLEKEGRQWLRDGEGGKRPWDEMKGGCSAMEIARAIDKLTDARRTLRRAFGS